MICIIDTCEGEEIRGLFTSIEKAMTGLEYIVSEDLEWNPFLSKQDIIDCYKIVDVKTNSTSMEWNRVFHIDWDNLFREVL